jgi:hypothetical protein
MPLKDLHVTLISSSKAIPSSSFVPPPRDPYRVDASALALAVWPHGTRERGHCLVLTLATRAFDTRVDQLLAAGGVPSHAPPYRPHLALAYDIHPDELPLSSSLPLPLPLPPDFDLHFDIERVEELR